MNTAEEAFYAHLTDPDSLDVIVREGFTNDSSLDVIPTEVGRKLTTWCIDQYFKSGRTVAPSKDAIMQTWGSQLDPLDISINDEYEGDSVQWAIEQLRTDYVDYTTGEFAKMLVKAVRQADPPNRVEVLQEHSQILHMLAQSVISHKNEMSADLGLADAVKRYEERAARDHLFDGLVFGLEPIDNHFLGVHPGELAVFAATSGGGKSWFSIMCMLSEWKRGRRTILFTLENDIEMTFDRIACVHCCVDYEKWQHAELEDGDMVRVREFVKQLEASDNCPIIAHPDSYEATAQSMVRRAQIEECDSIIIDQLSHIEPVANSKARQRNEIVAEIIRDLVKQINNSNIKIPCVLLHQISRKGREEARKNGHYLMDHLGEATQVENAAKIVLALYQSPDHVVVEQAEIQTLKFTRGKALDWEVEWRPHVGDVKVRREVEHD